LCALPSDGLPEISARWPSRSRSHTAAGGLSKDRPMTRSVVVIAWLLFTVPAGAQDKQPRANAADTILNQPDFMLDQDVMDKAAWKDMREKRVAERDEALKVAKREAHERVYRSKSQPAAKTAIVRPRKRYNRSPQRSPVEVYVTNFYWDAARRAGAPIFYGRR
jgi:hypothetical protein